MTLLCHGCPTQAIVAAFGLDERTVAAWLTRAGPHCQRVHQHLVQQGQVDMQHVQADELWVKLVGRRVWMAMAMAVPSRLWLGGVVSPHRDLVLITTLVQLIRACGSPPGHPGVRRRVGQLCHGLHAGVPAPGPHRPPRAAPLGGRSRGCSWARWSSGMSSGGWSSVERRVVRGTAEAIAAVLAATGSGTGINTADIERLNATFRAALAPLVRRGRAIAHTETSLTAGMWLVGCAYNFCWLHDSLRLPAPAGRRWKWQERTPAMAAGLTDHRWTRLELLRYQVPLPAWVAPKRRGRPPKQVQ